jgi:hypothetical protein
MIPKTSPELILGTYYTVTLRTEQAAADRSWSCTWQPASTSM